MNVYDPEFPLGHRIAVFGKGGKTTLSKALAERFGLEFVELDATPSSAEVLEMLSSGEITPADAIERLSS